MTTKQLVSQCIFPRLSIEKFKTNQDYQKKIENYCQSGIGGFIIFEGNIESTKKIINILQKLASTPLLFLADFEHGLPMRFDDGTAFPRALAIGRNNNPAITYQIARSIAVEAKSIGVLGNLAPVCDINSNKKNPIINIRAYGEDAINVIKHSTSFIGGTQSENVLACAKHFPGHGDTEEDSHLTMPTLNKTLEQLENNELKPFIEAIKAGVRSIMIAHLSIPALDDKKIPASLSHSIITDLLKTKLGFNGLVISDALDMNAIINNFSQEDAVIMAINAGTDILLMPEDVDLAINTLMKKAESDVIFKNQLNNIYERIINEKKWCGLFDNKKSEINLGKLTEEHEKLALRTAYHACEIIGDKSIIEIKDDDIYASFAFVDDNINPASSFFNILAKATENDCDFSYIDENITLEELITLKNGIKLANKVIFAIFSRPTAYKELKVHSDKINRIIDVLADEKQSIVLLFGNPYIEKEITSRAKLLTYSDTLPSIAASIMYLINRTPDMVGANN